MTLETIVTIIGVGTALVALMQGYDWWKKRQSKSSVDIVGSAMALLKPYQEEVKTLSTNLQEANRQVLDLTRRLRAAESRADDLSIQLADAQTEVVFLRSQVKTMSQMIKENEENEGRRGQG